MDKITQSIESLNRAKNGDSLANYQAILQGFADKGIPANDIIPRENVFTYNAWLALNRQVYEFKPGVRTTIPTVKDPLTFEEWCQRYKVSMLHNRQAIYFG